jgi:hypothetical protein
MKAKPYKFNNSTYVPCETKEATHIRLSIPGPIPDRILPIITHGKREGTNYWSWNGDTENPTIRPSILSEDGTNKCHCWITDGKVIFLNDSNHEFAGKTMDLLEVE